MKSLEILTCVVGLAVLSSVSSLPSRVEKQAGVQIEDRVRFPPPRPTDGGGSPPPTIITLQHNPCEIIPWILEVAGNDLTEEDKEELEEYVEEMCDNSTESESSEERFFFNRPNPLQALNTLCTRLNSFIAGVSGLVVTGNDLATANATQLIATVITNMCGARRSLLREDEPAPQDSTPFPPPPFGSHPPPHPKEDDMDEDSEEGTRPPPPPPSGGPPPPSGGPPPRPWTIEPRN